MKKAAIALIAALILALSATLSYARIELPLRVVVNNTQVTFPDAQPFIDENSRTQIPVRSVSEALGADVDWDATARVVTVSLNSTKVVLTIGEKEYEVNGQKKQMDTAPLINDDRAFVPVKFISEALGQKVKWDEAVRTVYVNTNMSKDDNNTPQQVEINGFIVYKKYSSKLLVSDGGRYKYGKDYSYISMLIQFNTIGSNYEMECSEVEAILLQKVNPNTVNDAMNYIRTKQTSEGKLLYKEFSDGVYAIGINGADNGPIGIDVYQDN